MRARDQHYANLCGTCAAQRATQATVPLGKVGRERARLRTEPPAPEQKQRTALVVLECVAVGAAILAYVL